MAITLNTFGPNTPARSSEVNANFAAIKTAAEDGSYRAFTWGLQGLLSTGNTQGMQYIVPQAITVKKIWAKTSSGTATIKINKDGTEITHGTNHFPVTSTVGSTVSFNATTITAGQVLTLDITDISSATDLFVTLEAQITSIA